HDWLDRHHDKEQEAWLLHHKKGAVKEYLTLEAAVKEALCFGWIDGLLRSVDSNTYALRYSPRKPRSIWSENNKRRAETLIEQDRMTAAGLAKITQAQENGEWEAATTREDVDAIPEDLLDELQERDAWLSFHSWPASQKKQYLHWLSCAKKLETRQKRLQAIVDLTATRERRPVP
ncbi:MAG: YdeI/OmpD-associated family protein, partial [Dehalococcoidia bacterium]|nr:YdeI/OmpD-associated family protein [Dehalococcoidia bacterium]